MAEVDLTALEDWVQPLIEQLNSAERRKLTRSIALELRRRQQNRIKSQTNPDGTPYATKKPRLRRKKGRIKRHAEMFQKLRQARHLKARSSPDGVAVGYSGRAARIARIHQEGLLAQVAPNGPLYQYPARQLVGYSKEDREWLSEILINHLMEG